MDEDERRFRKIGLWLPWPTSQGWADAGGWWKKFWMWPVIAILVAAIITLTCLMVFFPQERIVTVTDVRTVTKTVTKTVEIPVETIKEVMVPTEVEVVREVVKEMDSFQPPTLQDPMIYYSAATIAPEVRLVFPNVVKGSVERFTYGIPSERDLLSFIAYLEGNKYFLYIKENAERPEGEVDILQLVGGLTEVWSSDAANGIVDPSVTDENDSFKFFLFYDSEENIRCMGYDPVGSSGGNYWVIERYPEAKFFLGLY